MPGEPQRPVRLLSILAQLLPLRLRGRGGGPVQQGLLHDRHALVLHLLARLGALLDPSGRNRGLRGHLQGGAAGARGDRSVAHLGYSHTLPAGATLVIRFRLHGDEGAVVAPPGAYLPGRASPVWRAARGRDRIGGPGSLLHVLHDHEDATRFAAGRQPAPRGHHAARGRGRPLAGLAAVFRRVESPDHRQLRSAV